MKIGMIKKLMEDYNRIKPLIIKRLNEFKSLLKRGDERVFAELVFCLLTPQSRAKVCWKAVENLINEDLLIKGKRNKILKRLDGIRFKNKKADYILEARRFFIKDGKIQIKPLLSRFKSPEEAREFLVKHIRGMGYKEASHFLRNIGMGDELAILDRHILKNLKEAGIIKDIPQSLNRKKYLELEQKFKVFCNNLKIPLSHADLLLWFRETGEVFK